MLARYCIAMYEITLTSAVEVARFSPVVYLTTSSPEKPWVKSTICLSHAITSHNPAHHNSRLRAYRTTSSATNIVHFTLHLATPSTISAGPTLPSWCRRCRYESELPGGHILHATQITFDFQQVKNYEYQGYSLRHSRNISAWSGKCHTDKRY